MSEICNEYVDGKKAMESGNTLLARHLFKKSLLTPSCYKSSLANLVRINLKEGKYDQARELLEKFQSSSSRPNALANLQQFLELHEYNFHCAKKYAEIAVEEGNMQMENMLSLARCYLQLGEYDLAEKFYETLCFNENFHFTATIELVYLYMLEEDYQRAYRMYEKIKENSEMTPYHHYVTEATLLSKLKNYNRITYGIDKDTSYTLNRLFKQEDKDLVEHIEKHKNKEEKMTNGCFYANLDLANLISIARSKIERMNPIHNNTSEFYKVRLDFPIGFKERTITSDICVVTLLGTKNILTIYPIALSSQFNQEDLLYDENLKQKRLKGGRR